MDTAHENLKNRITEAIVLLKDDASSTQTLSKTNSAFWSFLSELISSCVDSNQDIEWQLMQEKEFINFGLCGEILPNYASIRSELSSDSSQKCFLPVSLLTDWLVEQYNIVHQKNRRGLLERECEGSRRQMKDYGETNVSLQNTRKEILQKHPGLPSKSWAVFNDADYLLKQSITTKRAIQQGAFFSVEEKREHAHREHKIVEYDRRTSSIADQLSDPDARKNVREITAAIMENIQKIIELEESVQKIENEIKTIDQNRQKLSSVEIYNRLMRELDYIRDLHRLCAKRCKIEPRAVMLPDDPLFSPAKIIACINRILEFDPFIFKNERVPIYGTPSILLIPGNGNAIYDWKHNQIVVPLIPFRGNHMASIATGMIEYRLDVDEEKRLLTSYNQIKEHRGIRSLFHIKAKLTKDYVAWMTSEYQGFRVLPSAIRKWFYQEIAPRRTDIFTPAEYHPHIVSQSQATKMLDSLSPRLKNPESASSDDLWTGSILEYQRGNYQKSVELLTTLVRRDPDMKFALYNLGIACMKAIQKPAACEAFQQFIKKYPTTWWASVARDHLRHLR
jgi:tetratricopeptide (TPR) repeat protein